MRAISVGLRTTCLPATHATGTALVAPAGDPGVEHPENATLARAIMASCARRRSGGMGRGLGVRTKLLEAGQVWSMAGLRIVTQRHCAAPTRCLKRENRPDGARKGV